MIRRSLHCWDLCLNRKVTIFKNLKAAGDRVDSSEDKSYYIEIYSHNYFDMDLRKERVSEAMLFCPKDKYQSHLIHFLYQIITAHIILHKMIQIAQLLHSYHLSCLIYKQTIQTNSLTCLTTKTN
ncbi:Hypothetical_protein [Hexamita inflata]|uniref:Hypothetical_protein n=1 Tax=Hexamita inflata TaxID=28002 RepID=A0AA86Q9Y7_9EUKA|nr:Hypothetical protein HINF_LOCUS42904 [Hexamita inflata]